MTHVISYDMPVGKFLDKAGTGLTSWVDDAMTFATYGAADNYLMTNLQKLGSLGSNPLVTKKP